MSSKKALRDDERFARVRKDPRFWEMPDVERKVRIDKRFQSMFHDERFKLKYTVDKRGRAVSHTSTEDLKRFYKMSDSEQSEDEEEEEERKPSGKAKPEKILGEKSKKPPKAKKGEPAKELKVVEDEEEEEDDDDQSDTARGIDLSGGEDAEAEENDDDEDDDDDESDEGEDSEDSDSGPDLARGKGNIESSSDEDEEDEEMGSLLQREEQEMEHQWGELWRDAPHTDEVTPRLALCNMNWDRIKAKDLLVLFSSFKPQGGVVLSVTIYPSEFGKERMKAEEKQGPLELTSLPDDPDADTEEQRLYREKVRDYQFKRLQYYYAVVECDSPETAAKIYEECDGYEYESTSSTLDLRFIPDSMKFEDESKDSATDVDLSTYKPKLFTSTVTATSKVDLTWDETDHDRVIALNRDFKKDELLEMDFNAYLASSSEDEQEEEQPERQELKPKLKEEQKKKVEKKGKKKDQICKYRELVKSIQEKESRDTDRAMEMEVTWVPGLKENVEKLVKQKLESKEKLTPWEEYLQKKKEKKKERRKGKKDPESEIVISDDDLPSKVDLSDPFFSEELGGASETSKKSKKIKNVKREEPLTPGEEAELEKQKAEMALLMDDDEDEQHQHFNYDKIVEQQNLSKKKRKKLIKNKELLEEDRFEVDVKDPRFQAMFTSHLYNLDPSDPAYKKTKGTQSIIEEKQRRREQQQQRHPQENIQSKQTSEEKSSKGEGEASAPRKTMDHSLSLLIKSVRNKTEQFNARKKQRTK